VETPRRGSGEADPFRGGRARRSLCAGRRSFCACWTITDLASLVFCEQCMVCSVGGQNYCNWPCEQCTRAMHVHLHFWQHSRRSCAELQRPTPLLHAAPRGRRARRLLLTGSAPPLSRFVRCLVTIRITTVRGSGETDPSRRGRAKRSLCTGVGRGGVLQQLNVASAATLMSLLAPASSW